MSIKWPLKRIQGNSVMFHNCLFTDEPLILCDDNGSRMVIMDSRAFAKAYSLNTQKYDVHHIFEAEGMNVFLTATQTKDVTALISLCEKTPEPVIVKKYGRDIMVAMSPIEYEKRQQLF